MEFIHEFIEPVVLFMYESRSLGAFIILCLSIVTAKVIQVFADRLLMAVCRYFGLGMSSIMIELLGKPIRLTVLFIGTVEAVKWVHPEPEVIFYLSGILYSVLAVAWAIALSRLVKRASQAWFSAHPQGAEMRQLLENLAIVGVVVAAGVVILALWKVNITPFLASAGLAGVAVALAAKDTLANFFGGVNVFIDRPFKTGDYVVLESGERGEVVEIGVRSTRILTRDDVLISIPNSIIANTKVVNETAHVPRFRVRAAVGVAYGSDVDEVEETLVRIATENPLVTPDPVPRAGFRKFGDSSLNFELLCWTRAPADKGKLLHELNKTIYKEFARLGILIPFPQRDVWIKDKAKG